MIPRRWRRGASFQPCCSVDAPQGHINDGARSMSDFHPQPEGLPGIFPVFPLSGSLLLPRGKLPLTIFEPRYVAMVEDALGFGRMFGMIQPDGHMKRGRTEPDLYRIGCLGRISSFAETDDGHFSLTLTGVIRFRITEEVTAGRGYRRVHGDVSEYLDDLDLTERPPGVDRATLFAALREYFTRRGIDANWDTIRALPETAIGVTLAMVCPFEPVEKQALLEARTAAERDRTLLALLHMAAMDDDDGPGGWPAS